MINFRYLMILNALIPPLSLEAKLVERVTSNSMKIGVEKIAEGLGIPWGMDFLPNGKLIVTERGGELKIVDPGVFIQVDSSDFDKPERIFSEAFQQNVLNLLSVMPQWLAGCNHHR